MNKNILIRFGIILVVLGVVHSAFWFFKTGQLQKQITNLIAESNGQISVDKVAVAGYPLSQKLIIQNLKFTVPNPALNKYQTTVQSLEAKAGIFDNHFDIKITDKVLVQDSNGNSGYVAFNQDPKISMIIESQMLTKFSYEDSGYKVLDSTQGTIYGVGSSNITFESVIQDENKIDNKITANFKDIENFDILNIYKNSSEKMVIDDIKNGQISVSGGINVIPTDQQNLNAGQNPATMAQNNQAAVAAPVANNATGTATATSPTSNNTVNNANVANAQIAATAVASPAASNNATNPANVPTTNPSNVATNNPNNTQTPAVSNVAAGNNVTANNNSAQVATNNVPTQQVATTQAATTATTAQAVATAGAAANTAGAVPVVATAGTINPAATPNNPANPAAPNNPPLDPNAPINNPLLNNVPIKSDFNMELEYILTPNSSAPTNPTQIGQTQLQYNKTIKIANITLSNALYKIVISGNLNGFVDDNALSGNLTVEVQNSSAFIDYIATGLTKLADQKVALATTDSTAAPAPLADASNNNALDAYNNLIKKIALNLKPVATELAAKSGQTKDNDFFFEVKREKNLEFLINNTPIREILGKFN